MNRPAETLKVVRSSNGTVNTKLMIVSLWVRIVLGSIIGSAAS
ncbi:hypothetical protein [Reyranella sp.]|nr:hypothetical protein [Reyranella sp.]